MGMHFGFCKSGVNLAGLAKPKLRRRTQSKLSQHLSSSSSSSLASSSSSSSITSNALIDLIRPPSKSSKSSSSIRATIQHYFDVLLLIIPVTFRSQFDSYLVSFSSNGSTYNSSELPSLLFFWLKRVNPTVLLRNFTSTDINHFLSFCERPKFFFHIKD